MVSGCQAKDIETFPFEHFRFNSALYFFKIKKGLYLDAKCFWSAIYSISSNFAGSKGLASSFSNDHNFLSGVSSLIA